MSSFESLRDDLNTLLASVEGDPGAQQAFYNVRAALGASSPNEPFGYVLQHDWRTDGWSLFKGGTKEQADRMRQTYPKVHMVYAAPVPQVAPEQASVRDALTQAADLCGAIYQDYRDQYKGRGKYEPMNPKRADTHTDGCAEGASECEDAIRALISKGGA